MTALEFVMWGGGILLAGSIIGWLILASLNNSRGDGE